MSIDDDQATRPDPGAGPGLPRSHRQPEPMIWVVTFFGYLAALFVAHALRPWLSDLTLAAYAVAFVGGAAFLLRYVRTDWRAHPWGRHVMAFMVLLELLFALALSRRIFGEWPGLEEAIFLASCTFAGVVWWRYRLQVQGDRRGRSS